MELSKHEYLTTTDFKSYYNISGTDQDAEIQNFVDSAENEIIKFMQQEILTNSQAITFIGDSTNSYIFANFPITAINSLKEYTDITTDTSDLIDPSLYNFVNIMPDVYGLYYNTFTESSIYEINFTYGYANAAAVPKALFQILLEWTAYLYDNSGVGAGLLLYQARTENQTNLSITTTYKDILKSLKIRLMTFRKPTI